MNSLHENRVSKIMKYVEMAFHNYRQYTVNSGYTTKSDAHVVVNFEVDGKQHNCSIDPTNHDAAVYTLFNFLCKITAIRTYMVWGAEDNTPQTFGEYLGTWDDNPTKKLNALYAKYTFLKIVELADGMPQVMQIHSRNNPIIIQEMRSKNNHGDDK